MGKNNLHAFAVVALASVCGVNGIFNIEQVILLSHWIKVCDGLKTSGL
jgi:hypothetical protein